MFKLHASQCATCALLSIACVAPFPTPQDKWGGGVSTENPHVQRYAYCGLLEGDLTQRLPSGRGPSVTADVQVGVEDAVMWMCDRRVTNALLCRGVKHLVLHGGCAWVVGNTHASPHVISLLLGGWHRRVLS